MRNSLSVARLFGLVLVPLLVFLPLAAFQQAGASADLEIVSKRYSAGWLPVAGSYVEYEVRLTNTGAGAIEGRSLHVLLVSDGNVTHSAADYSVPALGPGESKIFHLGPFKMEQEGRHRLLAEIEGIALEYEPDSFTVYTQEGIQAALIAIPLIAAGSAAVGFSLYRRRRAV